mmetsp:Transcript_75107/g.132742  ORF Transcript_75107/g.132742 Transcript_75107/m.132742 type:complete len:240 (-) Transcript_75107:299-1018(-)
MVTHMPLSPPWGASVSTLQIAGKARGHLCRVRGQRGGGSLQGLVLLGELSHLPLNLRFKLWVRLPRPPKRWGDLTLRNTTSGELLKAFARKHLDFGLSNGMDKRLTSLPNHPEDQWRINDKQLPKGLRVVILGHVEDGLDLGTCLKHIHGHARAIHNVNVFVDQAIELLTHQCFPPLHTLHVPRLVDVDIFRFEVAHQLFQIELLEALHNNRVPMGVGSTNRCWPTFLPNIPLGDRLDL